MFKKISLASGLVYALPVLVLAQGELVELGGFIDNIISFINDVLVPLVFAIAFLVFIWGVFNYFVFGGDNEEKRAEGRKLMMYAIIGFVLMVSVWGIVNIVAGGLGLQDEGIEKIPNVPGVR